MRDSDGNVEGKSETDKDEVLEPSRTLYATAASTFFSDSLL